MPGKIHIGIGGWTFEPWRGVFYPKGLPHKKELEFASACLTSIEINGTYYSTFKPDSWAKWRDETPDGFVFSVKASRYCTNRKELSGAGEGIARFAAQGLGELRDRLGPVNWPFMATKKFDPVDLAGFFKLLPREVDGLPLRHALEVRHASFKDPRFYDLARSHNVAIVFADDDDFPAIDEPTADFTYARLMRTREDEPTGYAASDLAGWAKRAEDWAKRGDVFVYFISGAKVRAPAAAQALIERFGIVPGAKIPGQALIDWLEDSAMNDVAPETDRDAWPNPMGTDGFEFVEFAAPDPEALGRLFVAMGFRAIARHRSKRVTLYRQGDVNFIVNAEPESFAQSFARVHGPCICAMAFRVTDAAHALNRAVELGAQPVAGKIGPMELNIPAIAGIGGSLIYLVDRYGARGTIYDIDFTPVPGADAHPRGVGLAAIDHLTHNVLRGRMDVWAGLYETLFNFRQIRYFDIEGKLTGLKSRAMTSPDGKIRIPINESGGATPGRVDQIEEYLQAYHGEGIQHLAFATDDIHGTVEALRAADLKFLATPDTYYQLVGKRLPRHGEDLDRLRRNGILIDGAPDGGLLLQIFTENVIGPIFFEIIQRKGDEGFGEGNFRALFESIELDQVQRGVLKA